MKKLIATVLMLGSVTALAACTSNGTTELDETRTQAPYSDERTVGYERYEPSNVRSAEPVFRKSTSK